MKIVSENNKDVVIELPCGTKTVISVEDKWIMDKFPVWAMTGSTSRYVFCHRSIKTEYSCLTERVYLHRIIVNPQGKEQVDHKDRDRLNNRRSNLRIASRAQNAGNVGPKGDKKYKGVFYDKRPSKLKNRYISKISSVHPFSSFVDAKSRGLEKRRYLGHFKTAKEAALAHDKAAKEIYGEFAYLNFPEK